MSTTPTYEFGGWTQDWTQAPRSDMTLVCYGMITDLKHLAYGALAKDAENAMGSPNGKELIDGTSGTPVFAKADRTSGLEYYWTYGGQGAAPTDYPAKEGDSGDVSDIETLTQSKYTTSEIDPNTKVAKTKAIWDGLDIDDESELNEGRLKTLLKSTKLSDKTFTYTVLVGADWCDDTLGAKDRKKVKELYATNKISRVNVMAYGDAMWSESEIDSYLSKSLTRLKDDCGVPYANMRLGMTTEGWSKAKCKKFAKAIKDKKLAGYMVWEFEKIEDNKDVWDDFLKNLKGDE